MEINGIEITFREILASAVIVLAMLILGTVISGNIKQMAMERKQEYTTAIDISSEDRFSYGLRTDVGRAFCYGTLSAVDTVSEDRIGGPYMYIYCEEQHYNMHTRTVVHTDGKGHTYTTTEIYYSWDYAAFHDGTDIDQTRELLMSGADGWAVIFWIVWIILTAAAVFGFCTLENDWLK